MRFALSNRHETEALEDPYDLSRSQDRHRRHG
jgi:hypothetical protein